MPSSSHKKCQYQGEGCMGTAHAGHDQCAHCYFTYIKPVLKEERQEVKRRRALKRGQAQTPSPETRHLISELDLKQQAMTVQPLPRANRAIRNAILDVELERLLEGKTDDQAVEVLMAKMIEHETPDPLPIRPVQPIRKEEPHEDVTKIKPVERKNRPHTRTRRDPLSDEEKRDITDAYAAGIPTPEIAKTWGVGVYTIYQLADAAGLPRRGRGRQPEPAVTEEDQSMAEPVSAPVIEPAPSNGVVSGLTEWAVTYTVQRTETTVVQAKSFNAAAVLAVATVGNDIDIIGVAKVKA